jgi:1,4-alpha-glucan branching enzyme
MGATPFDGGVTFRVWAPFAASVAARGEFNDWGEAPLASEGDGSWSADVRGAAAGQRYKYFITNRDDGQTYWRRDPRGLGETAPDGDSIVTAAPSAPSAAGYVTPPFSAWVIYELHVGTFSRDPSTKDGHGTFDSLAARLDDLVALGVNVVQLLPSNEFPDRVSEGYDPCDLFAIDADYGGVSGFLRFVAAAHARGLAVVMDVVYNHFGNVDLDLWRFDGWYQGTGGGIYVYNDDRAHTDWGDTRPDYGRPEVRQFLRDNALYWCDGLGVDGLRWDAVGFIRNARGDGDPAHDLADGYSLLQAVTSELRARSPWKLMIAEDMRDDPRITRDPSAGGAGFGAQWSAGFLHGVRDVLLPAADEARDVERLRDALLARDDDPFGRVLYTESHDEVTSATDPQKMRLPAAIDAQDPHGLHARQRAALGAVLVMTARGVPMLFQGQEFASAQPFDPGTPLDRAPAAALPGFVRLYRDLIALRRGTAGLARGLQGGGLDVTHVNASAHVIAYHRFAAGGPGDDVVVVVNLSNRVFDAYDLPLPRAGAWQVRFNSDATVYGADLGDVGLVRTETRDDGTASVRLGAYAALILSQDA